MEEYLWGFTNAVPLRALFKDGQSMPVVGFTGVKGPVLPDSEITDVAVCGIAVYNNGLIICERFNEFIAYGESIGDCQKIYEEWIAEQRQGFEGNETMMETGMGLVRGKEENDITEQSAIGPGTGMVDEPIAEDRNSRSSE